jgi:hypothetical protein
MASTSKKAKPAAKLSAVKSVAKPKAQKAKPAAVSTKPGPLTQPLPRTAKGKRPRYFQDPATDRLQAMVVALMAELSVTRDRLDTFERLIDKAGLLSRARVEAYDPDTAAEIERAQSRAAYIARVMRPLSQELDEMKALAAN